MPKPLLLDRPKNLCVSLPESLYVKTHMHLYSEAERRVPHGAWRALVIQLLEEYFNRIEKGSR